MNGMEEEPWQASLSGRIDKTVMECEDSSRIFIVMLHLYGTREDTKIWAKIISAHANKCSRMEVSVAEGGGWDKKGGSVATSWGMNAKQGDYKCGGRINTLPNTHGYYDGL